MDRLKKRQRVSRNWIASIGVFLLCLVAWGIYFSHSLKDEGNLKSDENSPLQKKTVFVRMDEIPLYFEKNEGQMDENVKYFTKGEGYTFYFTPQSIVISLQKTFKEDQISLAALKMQFVDATCSPFIRGMEEQVYKTNYFIGTDPGQWHTNVPNFAKVRYEELYPGVDAIFYGNKRQLEYDLCVAPGSNPKNIRLHIEGMEKLSLDLAGHLHIHVEDEQEILMHKPVVYQMLEGSKVFLEGDFILLTENEVGFALGDYDQTKELIIDPTVDYSTYLGGSLANAAIGIAVDITGNAYVTGTTTATNFPTIIGAFQTSLGGSTDGFVTKVNSAGSGLIYSTYLGGSGSDQPKGITIDSLGDAYVTGSTTSANFPTTVGAFQSFLHGSTNAFVTRLNVNGSALIYSTYLGGSGSDTGNSIAIDSSDNAYVTGSTTSANFPTTAGVFQSIIKGTISCFLTKFDPIGDLLYSTYFGGTNGQQALSIAVDNNHSSYITGLTLSSDFPTTSNAFQTVAVGATTYAFMTNFNSSASGLIYSTYLGTSTNNQGMQIALDTNNNVYIGGSTSSSSFPVTAGAFLTADPGAFIAFTGFVTKINVSQTPLVYSTYLGGSLSGSVNAITVDSQGNAYVAGTTSSQTAAQFPVTIDAFQSAASATNNGFIAELNSTGSGLIYCTYLGATSGAGISTINGIALDTNHNFYVAGRTAAAFFPTTTGAFQTALTGATNGFITKFGIPVCTVTGLSPNFGPESGGTSVVITGTNFFGVLSVHFGGTPAASFIVDSPTQITAVSPAGSGTVDVTVTVPNGTSPTSPADEFTYIPAPTVTGISPNSGPTAGGTSVTITGTNFISVTAVNFGGTPATSFIVNSSTQITAISPPGSGTVDVTVTTPGGTSAISPADEFTYIPAPVITGISPPFGPTSGGTSVTITGTNFTGATAVNFGGTPATSFIVNSPTQITAISPPGSGTVDITVTTPDGTSAISPADEFTYLSPPTVTGISPNSGPTAGGTSVTITGTNFISVTAVNFGGTPATSFIVNSPTQITAISPPGSGTVDVTVTTPGGTSAISAADEFTYIPAPVITGISPHFGPTSGGTSVTITGTNFTGATAVNFGGTPAASFIVNSLTQITAVSPPGSGTVDITVTTPDGTSAISPADEFTYLSPPTVTGISPHSGPMAGGASVTITGTNFISVTAVNFGGTPATSFIVNSPTQITAVSPPGSGTVDVTVTTPGGTSAISAADEFTYIPAPTVTGISPHFGPASGGTSVTITGTNFTGATAVNFGGTPATSFIVNSPTQITAVSPPGSGTVDVTVTTPGGTSAISAADEFTYIPSPTVTGISPHFGPISGGTSVTITGTNFTGATAVNFGGTPATSFIVNSPTQITAVSPPGSGTVDVTVTTPDGTSAISPADEFTYPQPTSTTLTISTPSAQSIVTLTAIVNPSTANGTITFFDNGNPIGTASLVNGTASLTTFLFPGTHVLVAIYSGNSNFLPSSASTTITIPFPPIPPAPFPPVQLKGVKKMDQFATQIDIVNVLTWKAPTQGSVPVAYRIYRNQELAELIGVVSSHEKLQFDDHNRKKGKTYTYWVVSVDNAGNVSKPAIVTVHD